MEAEAAIKQEVANDGGISWTSGEVSSTSTSVQNTQRSETSSYDCLIFEPQLQHGSHTTQNPLGAEAGCSSASNSGGSFTFPHSKVSLSAAERPAGFQSSQQRAVPADELPVRKEMPGEHRSFIRRGGWRQDAISRAASHRGEDGGGKSFVCNCCGKKLACLKNLKTHMRVHTGEKPFVCALCGKRFSDSSNLKRHQSVHTGEKRYGCVHCGKRFAQSGSLKVHMTVHTDCKQFRCSYCNKTFISGSHLRRHITLHAGEKRFGAVQ